MGRIPRSGRGPDDETAPIRLAPQYRCTVLGLFGGAGARIPLEAVERFRQVLDEAGVRNEIVVYDGAPHSFFDRTFDQRPAPSGTARTMTSPWSATTRTGRSTPPSELAAG